MNMRFQRSGRPSIGIAPFILDRRTNSPSVWFLNLPLARPTWASGIREETSCCRAQISLTRVSGSCVRLSMISLVLSMFASRCSLLILFVYEGFALSTWSTARRGNPSLKGTSPLSVVESHNSKWLTWRFIFARRLPSKRTFDKQRRLRAGGNVESAT